jgi:hypothetical protein
MRSIGEEIWCIDGEHRGGPGIVFPLRTTVVRLPGNQLWVHSPQAWRDELADELAGLGEVRTLIAPNGFHHMSIAAWAERYPEARVFASSVAAAKHPELTVAGVPTEGDWNGIESAVIEGSPKLEEYVFLHRPSASLLITDLMFNMHSGNVTGWLSPWVFGMFGGYGRPAQSKLIGMLTKSKAEARTSAEKVAEWPFRRIVVAHGDIIEDDARNCFANAMCRMAGQPLNVEAG